MNTNLWRSVIFISAHITRTFTSIDSAHSFSTNICHAGSFTGQNALFSTQSGALLASGIWRGKQMFSIVCTFLYSHFCGFICNMHNLLSVMFWQPHHVGWSKSCLCSLTTVPNFVFLDFYVQNPVQTPPVIGMDAFPSSVHFQPTHLPLNKQGLTLLRN